MWREIKATAGVDLEAFVGMHTYPDDVTYRLVEAASAVMHISSAEVCTPSVSTGSCTPHVAGTGRSSTRWDVPCPNFSPTST